MFSFKFWSLFLLAGFLGMGVFLFSLTPKPPPTSCQKNPASLAVFKPFVKEDLASLQLSSTPYPLPSFDFLDAKGNRKNLSDFKGKFLLVNFWATWCIPCREEMPALDSLAAKEGGDKFEILAINIDTTHLERRQAFLSEARVTSLAFYADPKGNSFQTLRQAGLLLGLPTSFFIDPEGCHVATLGGPAHWDGPQALALIQALKK